MNISAADGESESDSHDDVDVGRLRLSELERIEKKVKQGQELTPEEARVNAAAKKQMKVILPSLLSGLGIGDPRTRDQYKDEVERHLRSYKSVLTFAAVRQYILKDISDLKIVLSTEKEKSYEKVEVVLRIKGRIYIHVKDEPPKRSRLPERPTPYGQKSWLQASYPPMMLASAIHPQRSPVEPKDKVEIEREEGLTTITYPPVTIRPGRPVKLPALTAMTSADAGTIFQVEWSATSTSAEGHLKGAFEFRAGDALVDAKELLADALREMRD
ncbi:hypothetical protein ABZ783_24985 [Micromonospora sp. NPDC047738]|uniref:hypothetical protein n=1 Tax=Micromonospora sp. NPDC047738 TaxID=3155741 RepID=UPI0033C4EE23